MLLAPDDANTGQQGVQCTTCGTTFACIVKVSYYTGLLHAELDVTYGDNMCNTLNMSFS